MALSKEEIIERINQMDIYEKDYPIIKKILATNDPNFIVAVTEEVIKGNLYWSDFEELLSEPEYKNLISNNFKVQKELQEELNGLIKLRNIENLNNEDLQKSLKDFALIKGSKDWTEEEKENRYDMLYSILKLKDSDTILEKLYKNTILNALENYSYLQEIKDEYPINIIPGDSNHIVYEGKSYSILDPNDILLFINDMIIPVEWNKQILTDVDYTYMKENNLSENEMKKIKSLYIYFKTRGENNA